jgi:hypothetical protein
MTTFEAALKVHYTDARIKNLVYKNNPLLAMLPKMESFGGKNLPIPIQFGVPQSRSATFTDALNQKSGTAALVSGTAPGSSSKFDDFVLTRVKDYCIASIDNETMEASIGNPNAFMEAASNEINSALLACTRSLAGAIYRDGSGNLGQVSAIAVGVPVVGQNTVTLVNADDIVNFEVGQTVIGGLAGAAPLVGPDLIIAVDRTAGSFVVDPNGATPMLGASTTFVYAQGDYNLKVSGLGAWIPDAAPAATPFFSVDRSVDTTRLGGVRLDASVGPMGARECLHKAAALLAREGGRPTHCFISYTDYSTLLQEMAGDVSYAEIEAYERGDISFASARLHTPTGTINVIPDLNCPQGNVYLLQMDTWKLYSLGGSPKILQSDGMRFLREATSDGVEVRCGYYAQLGCNAPGWNAVITNFQ